MFVASAKPGSRDKWSQFRLTRKELPDRILGLLQRDAERVPPAVES